MEKSRVTSFLAGYTIAVPEAVIPQLVKKQKEKKKKKKNDAIVLSWRQQIDCNTSVYQGHLRQYWQPYHRLYRQPVYVVKVPVPVRRVSADAIPTHRMDNQTFYAKSRSMATRIRDKLKKQKIIENKNVCSGLPFFGLKEDELRHEILNEVSSQEF